MTKDKSELQEALEAAWIKDNGDLVLDDCEYRHGLAFLRAAQRYAAIEDSLNKLIAAREKAPVYGENDDWRVVYHNWHEASVYIGDEHLFTHDLDCVEVTEENQAEYEEDQKYLLEYITTAANEITRIAEILKGE